MKGALAGVTVLDFTTLLPGPMATLMLAEAGAEVIKVERPGTGDDMRGYQPRFGDQSVNFAMLNRGKRSIALDLKDPVERARLMPLVDRADVLIEQYRPGVMERLGLGYEAVSARNPGIVYCSITGYGQDGPKRDVAGHDLNYIGDAGLLSLSHGTPEQPVLPPALIADIAGGSYPAVVNILLALRERDRAGHGCHIDVAMTEAVLPFAYWAIGGAMAVGKWPRSGGELVTGGSPRYHLYPTRDGRLVAAAPLEPKFWAAFCDCIGLEARWRDDAVDPAGTTARVAEIIATETAETWAPRLAAADCCCSIVRTLEEALDDPHFIERGLFAERLADTGGDTIPALALPLARSLRARLGETLGAPELGADNDALLD
ncbi:MAG: CoA transferase [Ectothiorhodospiraceae bacterium]|nr:CoA transferase [Ectothiorhodospiraceae bacterium]